MRELIDAMENLEHDPKIAESVGNRWGPVAAYMIGFDAGRDAAAALAARAADARAEVFVLGFASYPDNSFELIVRNKDYEETTLCGTLKAGQFEIVDRIIPTCVYVNAAALAPATTEADTAHITVKDLEEFEQRIMNAFGARSPEGTDTSAPKPLNVFAVTCVDQIATLEAPANVHGMPTQPDKAFAAGWAMACLAATTVIVKQLDDASGGVRTEGQKPNGPEQDQPTEGRSP